MAVQLCGYAKKHFKMVNLIVCTLHLNKKKLRVGQGLVLIEGCVIWRRWEKEFFMGSDYRKRKAWIEGFWALNKEPDFENCVQ